MKKVLILGSGLVARPIIRYLLDKEFRVTVASNTPGRAIDMIGGHRHGISVEWDAEDENTLDSLVRDHNLTVSLLPWTLHLIVARFCLKHRKSLVTTSYVKEEMKQLDKDVREAGIIFLNEIGLDPGIDHMSAMRIIDHIHSRGGAVLEFYSFCGALPAPEAADNPFRYKFSWSPMGVLLAGNNDGIYLKRDKVISVPTEELFRNPLNVNYPGLGTLEVYPNRDSIAYRDLYGIPETRTLFRGTFRYKGWCGILDGMKRLGLFSTKETDMTGLTYKEFMSGQYITTAPRHHGTTAPEAALRWLGLYDNTPMNRSQASPFDVTAGLMMARMELGEGERDMIVMQHSFLSGFPDGRREVIRSRMVNFGTPGEDTAIARSVALPAAIATEMILSGGISITGVHIPVISEIYEPVLNRLETMGIRMDEEYGLPLSENIQ